LILWIEGTLPIWLSNIHFEDSFDPVPREQEFSDLSTAFQTKPAKQKNEESLIPINRIKYVDLIS